MADNTENAALRRCLPVEEWPALDRAAWAAAHRRGGLLDHDGLAVDWAPRTSVFTADGYGRFLWFLTQTRDLNPHETTTTRVNRARVEAYVAELRELNHSSTVAIRLYQLVRAAAVMAPNAEWGWLRRILARLHRMATPARDYRARLVPATTLYDLGARLMQRAEESDGMPTHRRALLFRDGLMICILCACPVRARNIAAMSIGTSLAHRGEEWWVVFGPGETKTGRSFEVPLPAPFTGPIERYLDHYRSQLIGRSAIPITGDAFWITSSGKRLTAQEVGKRVSLVTQRELGRNINPHLFRKIVPTELAIRDPEHVGIAQPLLGHDDYRTTQQAYNLGRALDAARRSQSVIQSIRAGHHADDENGARRPARKRDAVRTCRPSRRNTP